MKDELYFSHSVTLRIFGEIRDFDEITKVVGVKPTYIHRKGDKLSEHSKPRLHDMWSYEPNISEEENLSVHLNALWAAIGQNSQAIKALKESLTVNIFCAYSSNCDHAGFSTSYQSLTIFNELEVPFDVSVMLLPED